MSVGQVDEIRSFNWTVTQRVGALNDRFLARDRPLGPSRLLWEIGERLVTTAVTEIRTVDPTDRDARQCIRAYFAELDRRSESGFDPSAGISADPHELIPPAGAFLIAYLRGEPAGCGAVKHHPGAPSELKRMWVAESARGLGIGRRLLAELEACAVRSGASVARLETNRALFEAIAMYRSAGYIEVPAFNDEPFAHHWFEKRLG
jgi:GNAT superfamily N-acetyltransferase